MTPASTDPLREARRLAESERFATATEYQREVLRVLLAICDRLGQIEAVDPQPAPTEAPPNPPNRKRR